jgi:hypothetical protein
MITENFQNLRENENLRQTASTLVVSRKPRPSFQPTVYESMNEIPDYFFLEKTYSDDSHLDQRMHPHHTKSNSSKSLEKIKINFVKRKSLNVKKLCIDYEKSSKDLLVDEVSMYENTIKEFQAQLKISSKDNPNTVYYLQGCLAITEFRLKFNFENTKVELEYSKEYYYVPIYLIKK